MIQANFQFFIQQPTDHGVQLLENIVSSVVKSWVPPPFASLHWDWKVMINQEKHLCDERLAVAVGDDTDIKLLGVPAYPTATDKNQVI